MCELEQKQKQNKQQLVSLRSLKDLKLHVVDRKTQPNSWVRVKSRFGKKLALATDDTNKSTAWLKSATDLTQASVDEMCNTDY